MNPDVRLIGVAGLAAVLPGVRGLRRLNKEPRYGDVATLLGYHWDAAPGTVVAQDVLIVVPEDVGWWLRAEVYDARQVYRAASTNVQLGPTQYRRRRYCDKEEFSFAFLSLSLFAPPPFSFSFLFLSLSLYVPFLLIHPLASRATVTSRSLLAARINPEICASWKLFAWKPLGNGTWRNGGKRGDIFKAAWSVRSNEVELLNKREVSVIEITSAMSPTFIPYRRF